MAGQYSSRNDGVRLGKNEKVYTYSTRPMIQMQRTVKQKVKAALGTHCILKSSRYF